MIGLDSRGIGSHRQEFLRVIPCSVRAPVKYLILHMTALIDIFLWRLEYVYEKGSEEFRVGRSVGYAVSACWKWQEFRTRWYSPFGVKCRAIDLRRKSEKFNVMHSPKLRGMMVNLRQLHRVLGINGSLIQTCTFAHQMISSANHFGVPCSSPILHERNFGAIMAEFGSQISGQQNFKKSDS